MPPATVAAALSMLDQVFDVLNAADIGSLPTAVQGEALRALERAQSRQTAAQARILAAFTAQGGPEADGQGSARTWLRWQTRVTKSAALGAIGWMRCLAAHPVIERALAAGEISASWARQLCEWTDRLPANVRDDADRILTGAAGAGAGLADLSVLAEEMYQRSRPRDSDNDGGFGDRYLRLGITFQGAGRLDADLTPGCAAAVSAVLDALGKKAGPEDTRTAAQRRHDALAEACKRLIASGMLPGRAGQPTHIQVHMSLRQLRGMPGAAQAGHNWINEQAGNAGQWPTQPGGSAAQATRARTQASGQLGHAAARPGWLTGPEAEAAACDATVIPIVTGHVDWAALERLTNTFLAGHGLAPPSDGLGEPVPSPHPSAAGGCSHQPQDGGCPHPSGDARPGSAERPRPSTDRPRGTAEGGRTSGCRCGGRSVPGLGHSPATRARLSRALLALAADVVSGPDGLAARLRASLGREMPPGAGAEPPRTGPPGAGQHRMSPPRTRPWQTPLTSVSLPLDVGTATETIPGHLRRAVTTRHPYCAFPGCDQPASVCDVHHIVPRSRGGPTALRNLVPLCTFHHQVAVHRWGWTVCLFPDGVTAATSPAGDRTLYSHGPPTRVA